MESTNQYVPELAKEKVPDLNFPDEEVLTLYEERANRKRLLQRAADFGNYAQYKVAIVFADNEGKKRVETTIWDIDERNVYLKNRIAIPLHRILSVKI
jgi:uncharacterized protein (UPF0248 family)